MNKYDVRKKTAQERSCNLYNHVMHLVYYGRDDFNLLILLLR